MKTISNQIKKIRKVKQRSLHDCAKLIGISKEEYHDFEEGNASLSLPEIELLAIYFEIPPIFLFRDSNIEFEIYSLLSEEKKQIFKNLRNKMIGARLAFERDNVGLGLEDLNNETGISVELLESYEGTNSDIPLDHLTLICNQLNISLESLLFQDIPNKTETSTTEKHLHENPEYLEKVSESNDDQNDFYQQMIRGIKSMPQKDQAEIAKMLLERLKSL